MSKRSSIHSLLRADNQRLRTRVAELEAFVALLQTAKEQAEHAHNEMLLSLPERDRSVAERQREACANAAGPEWTHGTLRDRIRTTPLVTEGGE